MVSVKRKHRRQEKWRWWEGHPLIFREAVRDAQCKLDSFLFNAFLFTCTFHFKYEHNVKAKPRRLKTANFNYSDDVMLVSIFKFHLSVTSLQISRRLFTPGLQATACHRPSVMEDWLSGSQTGLPWNTKMNDPSSSNFPFFLYDLNHVKALILPFSLTEERARSCWSQRDH